jgi:hypothetical protein
LNTMIVVVIVAVLALLCILNGIFAVIFRKRQKREVLSYITVGLLELLFLSVALVLHFGGFHHIPYRFPASLPVSRTEVGAAFAVGIGLFPAAYWHRTSTADLRIRMVKDARLMKERSSGVHVREQTPGEWMN